MILNSKEILDLEKKEISTRESSFSLMQSAGENCFKYFLDNILKKKDKKKIEIIVLVGPGNNGGDGLVITKKLFEKGINTNVFLIYPIKNKKKDIYKAYKKIKIKKFSRKDLIIKIKSKKSILIIDCIFGIGLNRKIDSKLKKLITLINNSKKKIISIDIPSGINSDDGVIMGSAIKATETLALHAKKIGHVLYPGSFYSGKIKVIKIGIKKKFNKYIKSKIIENHPKLWIKNFPFKKTTSHKYSRGKVFIHGSKINYLGACLLSSEAALRVGTGSVTIVANNKTLSLLTKKFFSVLKKNINNKDEFFSLLKEEKISSYLIGPGAGTDKNIKILTKLLLKEIKYAVLDADALTVFKNSPKNLFSLLDKNKILTPHFGEFNKIFKNLNNLDNKILKVKTASKQANAVVVLKGPDTVIASPDGKVCVNTKTTKELAVIGSGDVLSGIIVSLMGDGKMNAFDAACAGVWIHSQAAINQGKGLIAEDIIKGIPSVLDDLYKVNKE